MKPAIEAEKLGIPSVTVTTTGFTAIAKAVAKAEGMADARIAEYPGPVGVHPDDLVVKNVEEVLFDRIIASLTKATPLAGASSKAATTARSERAFEGSVEEITAFFEKNEWLDGLPIVPPTPGKVNELLAFTTRAPDEVIATLPQANLAATPRNIAANGVMAGCRPEHMPLLIAAVQAIADNDYNLANIGSTWGVLPFLLINGPAIRQMGVETGGQMISRGANPSIGRALRFIVQNIAGYKYGKNYMATFGYPIPFVIAENDSENPWAPYRVDHGFKEEDSTVTACGSVTWGWPPAIYGSSEMTAAESALKFLSLEITKKPCLARLAERGSAGFRNMITVMLAPPVAKALAAARYTKQKIKEHLYEHARVPYEELEFVLRYGHSEGFTIKEAVKRGLYPEEYLDPRNRMLRVLPSPDNISVVVCGDPNRNRVMVL